MSNIKKEEEKVKFNSTQATSKCRTELMYLSIENEILNQILNLRFHFQFQLWIFQYLQGKKRKRRKFIDFSLLWIMNAGTIIGGRNTFIFIYVYALKNIKYCILCCCKMSQNLHELFIWYLKCDKFE